MYLHVYLILPQIIEINAHHKRFYENDTNIYKQFNSLLPDHLFRKL